MESALIILVLMVIIVAVVVVWRRKRPNIPPDPESLDDPSPIFTVVTVGVRGSGKTLLLASMYHELQTLAGRSYLLTAPHEQVIALNEWYSETADAGRDWPAGTTSGETRSFTFTVRTRVASGKIRPVFQVDYPDYAGGLLTDAPVPGSTAHADVLARIGSAHALVCIIDGFRIRQCFDSVEEGRLRLREAIDTMISLTQLLTCPVTFVITKWDLLRDLDVDENASLKMVKKQLMYIKGFRDLVEQHSTNRVVRLIPVSAVGPDFATLNDAGRVTKLPDGELNPTDVDVPLCAVVPDLFEQVEREVDFTSLQREFDRIRKKTRLGPGRALAELGRFVTRVVGGTLVSLGPQAAGFVGDAALMLFHNHGDAEREKWEQDADRQLTIAQQDMEEFRIARRRVLRDFQRRVDVLEGRLPSSRLLNDD